MDAKQGWKVVKVTNGEYYSVYKKVLTYGGVMCECYNEPDATCFHYIPGVWHERQHGPFALFSNLEDATYFISEEGLLNCIIVPCQYERSTENNLWIKIAGILVQWCCMPNGAVLADKVRLSYGC